MSKPRGARWPLRPERKIDGASPFPLLLVALPPPVRRGGELEGQSSLKHFLRSSLPAPERSVS